VYRHLNDIGREKAMCTELVDLTRSHLAMVRANVLTKKQEGA